MLVIFGKYIHRKKTTESKEVTSIWYNTHADSSLIIQILSVLDYQDKLFITHIVLQIERKS